MMPSGAAGRKAGCQFSIRAWWARKLGSNRLDAGLVLEAGLLLHGLDRVDLQVGPGDGQHDAGQAAAGSLRPPAARCRPGPAHRQRIEQVVGEHLALVADGGEVIDLVPLDQQPGEGVGAFWRVGGQIEAEGLDAVGEGVLQVHSGLCSVPRASSLRFSHTSSSEMAAG